MAANSNVQLPFTTSHAFIIGINDYRHLSPLHTAVQDATAIAQRLEDQHGFTVHAPLLNATHGELRKLLKETIPALVKEDDRILFYFAGHGIALDSEEGPNGYLVAADTKPGKEDTLISMQGLHDALTGLPCRHGLLVLDCCFAGAFKWSSGFRDVLFNLPKVIYEERFWRYCKDPAWQVITSAAHDQKAVDIITNQSLGLREENGGTNSPFAASLLKALDGDGDVVPAGEGDGVMTATELYSYLRDSVEKQTTENAKRQSPSIFNLQRHDKGEFIFLNPRHRFNLPPTPDRNPFMGLASYNETDASLFFGRDRVVEALLEKVKVNQLTVVSGASGTGKSSVIKAGVLPELRRQGRTILPILRPGKTPMTTLKTELGNQIPPSGGGLGGSILVIDQYEELITQCLHPEERIEFEKQLAQWLEQYPDLDIILSIRSDFEPQFESEALAKWWQNGRFVVPAFSLEEIREIITRPAAQAVLFYEPEDLIEQLSEEVSQAPGALPLLSFTLSELYHAYLKSGREDRSLAQEDYLQLGGVIGALRTRADAEYEALSRAEQSSMRKLMLRMVSLEGGELAGKRVYSEELQYSDAAETTRVQKVADRLVNARLLLKGTDQQGRTYVEPAHDALVRAWARLWEWIKATGEEKVALQNKLNQAVNDYHALQLSDPKKARNLLWTSNPRLDLLRVELEGKEHGLNAQEEEFVRTSVKLRTARRRTNWAIAIGVMVGLAGLALFAFSQQRVARANEQTALKNEELATQRAQEVQDSAKEAALQRLRANDEATRAVANSLASRSLLSEQTDPTVALRIAELALAYGPENTNVLGALLAAYYREDAPLVDYFYKREGTSPSHPDSSSLPQSQSILAANFGEASALVNALARVDDQIPYTISPNGEYLLLGFEPDLEGINLFRIIVRNARCGLDPTELYTNFYTIDHRGERNQGIRYYPGAFSRNGSRVLTPNDNRIDILKITHNCLLEKEGSVAGPTTRWAVFSNDEKRIIARSVAGTNYSWSLQDEIPPLLGNTGLFWNEGVYRVFCDTTGSDFVFIWEEDAQEKVSRRRVEGNTISTPSEQSLEFSEDQLTITSGGRVVVDLNNYIELFNLNKRFLQVAGSVDRYSTQLMGGHAIKITDQAAQREVVLEGHREDPISVSFDPNEQFIVTSSAGEIRFWDWRGYNFYATDFGGPTQLLPNGKSLCYWRQEREREQTSPYKEIMLLDIDPESIIRKINAHDIYQLTDDDRLKYGIEQ